ncbi:phage tail tape measure protein [Globicatella sp. PHS-GS-PNBC-21-1553]|uniref:phage tail tape measure protein n=1 Tax=Globicatella sp. PHS-GS-PNBC-21-1553 TaxID=2885764 RepID=UPI00298EED28|nr:phage tail tape measure protein [Globicatella sp. PHS-GS-PNBC-21-1553]WPC08794.1 phage tail tape measure protein [Globicatella sp. PHS-GS-PNBC-21-1553]
MATNNHEIKIDYKVVNSQFNKGIKEINSEVSTLNKEFRLQQEQMKLTASESEKLEAKLNKLNKEHELGQKKTREIETAYKNVVEIMGESSKEAETWKNKLLDAKKNEEYLKNAIQLTTEALDKSNESMSEAAKESEANREKLKSLEDQQKSLALESQKLTSEFKLEQSEMSANATEAEKLEKAKDRLTKQSELVQKQIKNLEEQLAVAKDEYGENSDEVLKLEASLNDSKKAFNDLNNEMGSISGNASTANDGLVSVTGALNYELIMQFSEKLGQLSDKLIELGKASLEAFREVDEGMDIVATKTGARGDALKELQDIVGDVATSIPTTFKTAGEAVGEINTQFGLQNEELEQATELMIKYAEINGTDVTKATIQSKRAIEAFRLENKDLGHVLDVTTQVAQDTGQTVDDLMDKATKGAPQIKALGLSFDEGVTLIGQFEQAGADSSKALSYLSKATIKYAKDGKTLEEGLNGTIKAIQNASSETEAMNIAAEVFGDRGAVSMLDAIQRGVLGFDELSDTTAKAKDSVALTFAETQDPIDELIMAQNSLTRVLGQFGDMIAKTIAPLLTMFTEAMRDVFTWINQLPEPVQQVIIMFGGLVTVFGTLLPIIIAIKGAIATGVIPIIISLISASLPIVGVIMAIIAAVGALIYAYQNWGAITEWLKEAWRLFVENISAYWEGLETDASTIFTAIKDGAIENFNTLKDSAYKIWDTIMTTISDKIGGAQTAVGNAIKKIQEFFNFEWKWPKIPLPRFTFSGSPNPLDWGDSSKRPNIGVEWYAKGGIMTSPTIFGFNGRNIMAGGEAGPEAILPLNKEVLANIGVGISATMNNDEIIALLYQANDRLADLVDKNTTLELNGRILAEEIRNDINDLNEIYTSREFRTSGGAAFA